ncbi:MAG: hypothetical protein FVQ81_03770 [Candidatus Glassbacteria bacterium]|nr:hypothetical protein [Candidatus Glassbacteria bacterium]
MKRSFSGLTTGRRLVAALAWGLLLGNLTAIGCGAGQDGQAQSSGDREAENAWTIGVLTGPSPFELSAPANVTNPVLRGEDVTDLDVNIVAHPFMIATDSAYYLFFTAKSDKKKEGGIGLAESSDGLHWKHRRIVVDEPYDLSYPYVFKWQDDYYMTPEAHTETAVRLYKATAFPDQWQYQGDIISGDHYISPTIFRHDDMWWMFAARLGNETLRLFYAAELMGPWTEHPQSPVIEKNLDTARPAGRPLEIDGRLYRIGQDCYPTYGNRALAFEITTLSTTDYAETMIETPLVQASSSGWNAEAMHHVDAWQVGPGRWLAVVDALGR